MALKINPYIEQEILDYSLSQSDKNNQQENIHNNSNQSTAKILNIIDNTQNCLQQNETKEEYKLEENLENFVKKEVAGDGNCLISSILTYLDIPI